MDHQSVIKNICSHAKNGEFSEALHLLMGIKLVKEDALRVLISTSNGCYYYGEKCDIDSIEKLVNIAVSCIEMQTSKLVSYLQSIFHITKLICALERFEDLAKLRTAIIPAFLKDFSLKDIEQAEHIYTQIIRQIIQSIARLAEAKNTKYNKHVTEIIKIVLKAHNHLNNPKDLLTRAQICFNQLRYLQATNDELLTLYSVLLEVIALNFSRVKEYTDTIQVLLVPVFSSVFMDIIESRNFEFALMFLDIIEAKVRSDFRQQEYLYSHSMFRAVAALFPCNKDRIEGDLNSTRILLYTFKSDYKKLFYNVISTIDGPLCQVLSFYKTSDVHVWYQLSETTIINILKFLMDEITSNSMLAPNKCSCGCSISKNYSGVLKIGCIVTALLKLYVQQSKDPGKEFFSRFAKWLSFFYGLVKKLKDRDCQMWSSLYSDLAGNTYNTIVALYKVENAAHKGIDVCFLRNSVELEGTMPKIRSVQLNTFVFSILCEIEFKNQNLAGCMGLAALHCLLYTQNSNGIIHNWWIKAKMKVKEDIDFQQQTLPSVLCRQRKQLSQIFDVESFLTTEKKIELLILELTRYKAIWKSKVSMMAAFGHLCEIADIPTIAEVIVQIYGDGDAPVHQDMSSIFWNVTKRLETVLDENPSSSIVRLALAVIYYYHFKTAFKETAEKNLQEMERTMQVLESAKKEESVGPVPKDANDECDIVSAYSSLQLSKFMEILKLLNTCEEHIGALLNDTFEPDVLKSIANLLIKIGFEYRLHCFSIKSLRSFEMSMKCSQKISDNEGHLFALSFLIERADVRRNFILDLIAKGDELVQLLEGDNEDGRYNKTLATYHVYKSKAFLYEDPDQSYEAWQKADKLCTANEDKYEFQLLRVELYIVLYKLTKNCDFIKEEHTRHPMTLKLHLAYDVAIEMVHKNILTSYDLCTVFDAVYEAAKAYHLMRLPRDLRVYSKRSVLLAQKIVLPIRCVSLLILLAHSDIRSCTFDHCTVKLNGIDDIFCLGRSRPILVPTTVENDAKKLDREIDDCTDLIQELVLDVPHHTRQYSPASPTLTVEGFKFPEFVYHETSCKCFMCLSLEFQQQLLQKYHLNAFLNMNERQDKVAEEFIGGALTLYKTLNKNFHRYKAKASELVHESLVPNFEEFFLEPYADILYEYSFHMCRKSLKPKALKINSKLIQALEPQKFRYVYMYHGALLQRQSYVVPEPQEKCVVPDNFNICPNESAAIVKTPSNRMTAITVMINGIPAYSAPKRKGKKCNLFTADDSVKKPSKESEELASFVLPKVKGKRGVVATPSTPFFGGSETPKIQIFTDDIFGGSAVKTYTRKRATSVKKRAAVESGSSKSSNTSKILVESAEAQKLPVISGKSTKPDRGQLLAQKIKEKSATTRVRKNLMDELLREKLTVPQSKENIPATKSSESDDTSVISESPEHKVAAEQTKLMLEKLKSSTKKPGKATRSKKEAANSDVKNNLLKEFEQGEAGVSNSASTSKSTGAIRKSARNRVL